MSSLESGAINPTEAISAESSHAFKGHTFKQIQLYKWKHFIHLLQILDIIALLISTVFGHLVRFSTFLPDTEERMFMLFSVILTLCCLHLARSYRIRVISSFNKLLNTLFVGGLGAIFMTLFCGFLAGSIGTYSRLWIIATILSGTFLLIANRVLVTVLIRKGISSGRLEDRVVMVGINDRAQKIVSSLSTSKFSGIRLLGIFEDRINRALPTLDNVPLLGTTDDLLTYVRTNHVDRIIVTLPWVASDRIDALLKKLRTVPVRIDLVPSDIIWRFPTIVMERIGNVPILNIANARIDEQSGLVKRIEDILISGILLLLISPILLLIAIAIKLDSKGPVFFKQKRHGFNNEVFEVFKFRSMTTEDSMKKEIVQATRNDKRVTRIGRFLRRSSLDELPQLLNVLSGTMSIVGPRPHAIQHNEQYAEIIAEYYARHNVKPGITGWAQVNGLRGETDTDDKMRRRVEADLHYIEHWSLLLDLKIIVMTAAAVWFQDTAY
jgi:Undecaprenyl-phosphate glucose phosphotransferase